MAMKVFRVTFDLIVDSSKVPDSDKGKLNPEFLAKGLAEIFNETAIEGMTMQLVDVQLYKAEDGL